MSNRIDRIVDELIDDRERGYVDHPLDRGGPTKYGVTIATLSKWRGEKVSRDDVKNLTREEARSILLNEYLVRPGLASISDPKLQELLFDISVHHGQDRAVRWLQKALEVEQDGIIGPITKGALEQASPSRIYAMVLANRIRFIGFIITNRPSQAVFAHGWANRVSYFVERMGE